VIDDIYMYPAGFAELLRHEDRTLKTFKLNINKEKERVDQDMKEFKMELNHTLEDLRLSLHAHLDRVYQAYMEKTSKFRGELFQIHRLKEQLEIDLGASTLADLQARIKADTQKLNSKYANVPERDVDRGNPSISVDRDHSAMYISPKLNPGATLQAQTSQTINNMEVGNT
jgi:hypothetical protein